MALFPVLKDAAGERLFQHFLTLTGSHLPKELKSSLCKLGRASEIPSGLTSFYEEIKPNEKWACLKSHHSGYMGIPCPFPTVLPSVSSLQVKLKK